MRILGSSLVLLLAASLAGCGKPETGAQESGASASAPAPELTDEQQQRRIAALPAPYNAADVEHGKQLFGVCRSCHTVAPGGTNLTGPNLHGVFGRQAASVAGYNYSPALKASGIVWTPQQLDEWLANPRTFLPGTKMTFPGLKSPGDRADVIAYLMVETAPAN